MIILNIYDIKKYFDCPRLVFFNYLMSAPWPVVDEMNRASSQDPLQGSVPWPADEILPEHKGNSEERVGITATIPKILPDQKGNSNACFQDSLHNTLQNTVENIFSQIKHRRKLAKYRLDEGEMLFRPILISSRLGLSGQPDLVIKSSEGLFPVEIRVEIRSQDQPKLSKSHLYQMAAYALLLEDICGIVVSQGFVYTLSCQDVEIVHLSGELKKGVLETVASIRQMLQREQLPADQAKQADRCSYCEFQNFCGDVW